MVRSIIKRRQMPHMETSKRHGSAALRNGLLFGAIATVVYIVSAFIQDVTGTTVALVTIGSAFTPLSLLNEVTLVVALVVFFVAGWRTSRTDERLSAAAGAGCITALVVTFVEIATIIVNQGILYRTTIAALEHEKRLTSSGFHFDMFLNPASGAILTLIIYATLGAGLGFVAGSLRRQIRQEAVWSKDLT
jgi:hypothetical protein